VAVGIALDVVYSRRMGYLDPASADRVLRLIEELGFEVYANELHHLDSGGSLLILQGLEEFREHLGGGLTITLLRGIGQGFEVNEMHPSTVAASIQELEERAQRRVQARVVAMFKR
jgi:3-dehydroquinate synthase